MWCTWILTSTTLPKLNPLSTRKKMMVYDIGNSSLDFANRLVFMLPVAETNRPLLGNWEKKKNCNYILTPRLLPPRSNVRSIPWWNYFNCLLMCSDNRHWCLQAEQFVSMCCSNSVGQQFIRTRGLFHRCRQASKFKATPRTMADILPSCISDVLSDLMLWNQSQFCYFGRNSQYLAPFQLETQNLSTASSFERFVQLNVKILALRITAMSYNRIGIQDWVIFKSTNRFVSVHNVAGVLRTTWLCLILRRSGRFLFSSLPKHKKYVQSQA